MQIYFLVNNESIPDDSWGNQRLALSVFFDASLDQENAFISSLNLDTFDSISDFTMQEFLLSLNQTYYTYIGSETTPPCHGNVLWFIFTTPVPMNQTQLKYFRNLTKSVRPPQSNSKPKLQVTKNLNTDLGKYYNVSVVMIRNPIYETSDKIEAMFLLLSKFIIIFLALF